MQLREYNRHTITAKLLQKEVRMEENNEENTFKLYDDLMSCKSLDLTLVGKLGNSKIAFRLLNRHDMYLYRFYKRDCKNYLKGEMVRIHGTPLRERNIKEMIQNGNLEESDVSHATVYREYPYQDVYGYWRRDKKRLVGQIRFIQYGLQITSIVQCLADHNLIGDSNGKRYYYKETEKGSGEFLFTERKGNKPLFLIIPEKRKKIRGKTHIR